MWELDNYTRNAVLDYIGYCNDDWNKCYDSIIKIMYMSSAGILLLPIQDILGYGSDTRLNTPGKADGNWGFRITHEQMKSIDVDKYRRLNQIYGR